MLDLSKENPSRHAALQALVTKATPPTPHAARPIVIIGAGGIVRSAHLPAYHRANFPILALADLTPGRAEELARAHNVAHSFSSVSQAIRFAPADAVYDVAVPAAHLASVLDLLPRGAAVLMQKPMGETLEQARHIRDLCRDRSFTAAVNFQLRYAPNHLGALALANAGVLGQLHDLEVQVRTYTPWSLWTFLAQAPRLEILYHSIHYLNLVQAWLGDPAGVYARTIRSPETPSLAATKTTMILNYGDDKRVFVATSHGHTFPETQRSFVQWEGTAGVIRMGMGVNLDYPKGRPDTLEYALRDEPGSWHSVEVQGNWFPEAFIGSMGSLQAFLEGSTPTLPTSVDAAFQTMALVEAAYRSSEGIGEPLPV